MWIEDLPTPVQDLPVFSAQLAMIYFIAFAFWSVCTLTKNKPARQRAVFSSCMISILHAGTTSILGSTEIYNCWPLKLDGVNTEWQIWLMQFSTAYMLVDLFCFLLPFTPDDLLFIGHHILTASYMLSSLWLGRGGTSCLVLMVLGESTSWLQNGFYLSRDLRRDSATALRLFKRISPAYTLLFVLVRTCMGPPIIGWLAMRLISQAPKVPLGLRYFWAVSGVLGVSGSQLWTYRLLRGFMKQRRAASTSDVAKKSR